jgi:hypothetical protein
MRTVFIQANNKQLLGALLAQYAIERNLKTPGSVAVKIMNVDDLSLFRGWREGDLQSFTLSRFLPPELMGYTGKAVVIDPDIFALTDINRLFDTDMGGMGVLACPKRGAWDTSVMLIDCARLTHWNVGAMLADIKAGQRDYGDIISMRYEHSIGQLPRKWNSLDHLGDGTKMLHTTNRLTQPWKTGLPIDFTRKDPGKLWGVIPRTWIGRIIGSWPSTYQPHPDKRIERFFFGLLRDALRDGAVTEELIQDQIRARYVRTDILRYTPS